MSSTDFAPPSAGTGAGVRTSRLIVTRRSASDRTYRAIGFLDKISNGDGSVYEFGYIVAATKDPSFVPIVGFADTRRHYSSTRLFPSFADRVMSAKRPDRPRYLAGLDLASDADAWEILTASGGHREGDPIELISLPTWDPTTHATTAHFLAHGVRHSSDEAHAYISTLTPGKALSFEPEPTNTTNPRAIRITTFGGLLLGYVPDPLLDYVHSTIDSTTEVTVVRANPADTHPHLRLLLRLTGRCERFVFGEPEWTQVA